VNHSAPAAISPTSLYPDSPTGRQKQKKVEHLFELAGCCIAVADAEGSVRQYADLLIESSCMDSIAQFLCTHYARVARNASG
jgi:hypothetical protein